MEEVKEVKEVKEVREVKDRKGRTASSVCHLLAHDFAEEHGYGVVELVDDALFERDDGVVGDVNFFGADFGAAFGDVAEADAEVVFEKRGAI